MLHKDSDSWAWCFMNNTSLPQFTGGWTFTLDAAEHFQKAHILRVKEARDRGVSIARDFPRNITAPICPPSDVGTTENGGRSTNRCMARRRGRMPLAACGNFMSERQR